VSPTGSTAGRTGSRLRLAENIALNAGSIFCMVKVTCSGEGKTGQANLEDNNCQQTISFFVSQGKIFFLYWSGTFSQWQKPTDIYKPVYKGPFLR
jgi:hypothetical protein